ncbi:hypothetical protein TURU_013859 [Turdus rufiventris]|nr:hypothetical protein TURU_013859 [Turdus rufiventris]
MSCQYALAAQRTNCVLGCIKSSMTSRSREVILPVYSALVRPHLEYYIQFWGPPHKKDMDMVEKSSEEAMEMIRRLESLSYEDRLKEWRPSNLEKGYRPYSSLPVPKGGLQEKWRTFYKGME